MRRIETFEFWDELLALKDELSLRELAEKFGVTPGAISAAFKRTATARSPAPPGPRSLRPGKKDDPVATPVRGGPRPGSKDGKLQEFAGLLGRLPDAEVADRAGVSQRTVASYRTRHDLPRYSPPKPAESVGIRSAWRVVIRHDLGERTEGVIVAPSLFGAARLAEELGRGDVLEVEYLGSILA